MLHMEEGTKVQAPLWVAMASQHPHSLVLAAQGRPGELSDNFSDCGGQKDLEIGSQVKQQWS